MNSDVVIAVLSVQTALLIFMLERLFALKRCISTLQERLARVEETLKTFNK